MRWMVSIKFNPEQRASITPLVPAEQEHVKALMGKRELEAIYISNERLTVWLVIPGNAQNEVEQTLKTFPLYPYMQYEMAPLS
jgi:muconolactone delta-isomerase